MESSGIQSAESKKQKQNLPTKSLILAKQPLKKDKVFPDKIECVAIRSAFQGICKELCQSKRRDTRK